MSLPKIERTDTDWPGLVNRSKAAQKTASKSQNWLFWLFDLQSCQNRQNLRVISLNTPENRTRRIKCDEARTKRNRCVKSSWACDGYLHEGSQLKPPCSTCKSLLLYFPLSQLSMIRIRTRPAFKDNQQGHYFRYYYEDVAAQIGAPFTTTLWERTAP
jgi:hypothetical protein